MVVYSESGFLLEVYVQGFRAKADTARAGSIVQMIARSESGILLTSYDQLRLQRKLLLGVSWGYAILDEGHKIRNPDAEARPAGQRGQGRVRVLLPSGTRWKCVK